ncbi:phospholipase [Segetibacter sp. 3557_3]|uniref:alpha/beta hydrolase n=1 Tax=Segetibacter sp. 3557_3 TaxID=2547429 RepID=UPI0010590C8C|nr:phospholipase [Segetibacter sp. 3557_3]TDH25231.1 phospholipase [Segetibacter sp. 3557_3]
MLSRRIFRTGRLTARPQILNEASALTSGVHPLQLAGKRDGFVYIPAAYRSTYPAALALMLHGAGGQADHGLSILRNYADEHNFILLAPPSRGVTWDIIEDNAFGNDVIFIDQALAFVFRQFSIDTKKIAVGGFSDGASYAGSIGLSNGDLFTHVLAFSPGFFFTAQKQGKPRVFISHGIHDHILPIDPCSRRIVRQLEKDQHVVKYMEFDGEHIIPLQISETAISWFLE